jgi:restriction endonuclease S subunit
MKNSGYDWIQEIPNHWRVEPIKYNVEINLKSIPESTPKNRPIRYIDIGSVESDGTVHEPKIMTFGSAPSRARRVISDCDTILSTVRTYLKAIAFFPFAGKDLICSTGFAVLTPGDDIEPKFLYYWVSSSPFVNEIFARSVGVGYPSIKSSYIGRLPCVIPTKDEQRLIIKLLDSEMKQISEIITKRSKLIHLLKLKKHALISYVIARGLVSDVPHRNSGIGWIDSIPMNWTILKFLCVGKESVKKRR